MKIGLISDTHGWIHSSLFEYFRECDEIWHAGDIGNIAALEALERFKPVKAVFGNIDDAEVRKVCSRDLRFNAEDVKIFMTHIGGSPGHYDKRIINILKSDPPDIFICGHSHIARIIYDRKAGFLFINPGAAGYIGFHKYMTAVRFQIDGINIHDMDLIELGERGKPPE